MKALLLFIVSLLISVQIFAQNDNDWDSRKYEIEDFSAIYLEGGYKVVLTQGDECALTIRTLDEDVLDNLKVENWGNELRLVMDHDFINYKRIRLYITFTHLEAIKAQGGLKLDSEGYLDLDDLYLAIEGGAQVDLKVKAKDVKIVGEGGVLVELDGIAERLAVNLSGAGHVDADELRVNHARFEIEGVGTGSVHAVETLYARIEGVGKVRYSGNPEVTRDIEGLGSVTRD
ncbi:MAG TPA: head GIN domain-containing protein [Draconibacterium sp.]|nr:head GIN domain-containing protein [Draconibacterium sp.]